MFFDIFQVMVTALLSVLIWGFSLIPSKFTFYIHETEDAFLFISYFSCHDKYCCELENHAMEKVARGT